MSEQVPDKLEDTAKDGVIEGAKPTRTKKPAKEGKGCMIF